MNDPFANKVEHVAIEPARKIQGVVAGLFKAAGADFATSPVEEIPLTFDGIPGDYHADSTRKSGSREPWYPRGTLMRNERQLSILAPNELRTIAARLEIPELKPEWIGGNLLLDGIDNFSMLPARTLLFFEGGVTVKVDGDNAPCRYAGSRIAAQFDGREDLELGFPKHAKRLRGLVGWVEKEGTIKMGEKFQARIPEQWIYQAD